MRQHAVEVQVNEPFDRLLLGERLRIEALEKALDLGGVHQHRGQAPCREAGRARPELTRSRAALQHLLDETPGAEDHLVKVEAGQFGKCGSSPWTTLASCMIGSRRTRVYICLITSTRSPRADPS